MGKNIITFIEFLISIVFICYSILQHLNLSVWFFVIAELLYFCVTVAEILFFEKKYSLPFYLYKFFYFCTERIL